MRIYEMILSPLENRMLRAYRKKNDLDLQDFIDMSDTERDTLFKDIAARYPVPKTDAGYFYHGTSKDRLPSIRQQGLTVGNRSRWHDTNIGAAHSHGRLFFTSNFDTSEWYASRWSKSPIYLRVKARDLGTYTVDAEEDNSVFVTHDVPPNHLEIWSGKAWIRIG